MHILNTEVFGFMVKPEDYESLDHAAQDFLNFKLDNLGEPLLSPFFPTLSTFFHTLSLSSQPLDLTLEYALTGNAAAVQLLLKLVSVRGNFCLKLF